MIGLSACGASYKLKDGTEAYNLKQYHVAIKILKKELEETKRTEDKGYKMFLIGKSYHELLDYNQALDWFNSSERNNYGASATLYKAYTLKNLMRYKEAAASFESLKSNTALFQEVSAQVITCNALQLQREAASKQISIESVFDVNLYSDYAAVIYDYDYLVFTSDRDESTGNDKYQWTGKKFSDLYITDKESKTVQRFDAVINTVNNEGTPAFNKDYTLCVFSRCFDSSEDKNQYCKLMYSNRIDGIWTEPVLLPFVKEEVNYVHPCFFESDSILIFAALGENAAQGYDLWYSEFDGNNWSEPFTLSNTINTTSNEQFPTANGDTLYFSSDSEKGFGGLDIYKSWVNANGIWEKPVHLSFPINSGGDDFSLIVDNFAPKTRNVIEQGYFSSSRDNEGHDKLYHYKWLVKETEKVKETADASNGVDKEIYLALKVVQFMQDSLQRKKTAINKATVWFEAENLSTDKNGLILQQLDLNREFILKIEKDSFLSKSIVVSTKDLHFNEGETILTINKEVELEKIIRGKEILLENIYYEYDEWNIRADAKPSLDKLARLLEENPTIKIELGSHTDCRGEDDYNQLLSSKRAESVVSYLSNKGISTERLVAKGYGETLPYVNCICADCNETQHQQNRRTSFKIL